MCQKSYAQSPGLSQHNKTAAHIERMKSKNTNVSLTQSNFVDFSESIKEEDIKDEIKNEESVDDPLTIHQKIENSNICKDIMEEVKEEESVDDPLTIHQKIENSNICKDIKEEVKEEESVEVPSFNEQELGNVWLD